MITKGAQLIGLFVLFWLLGTLCAGLLVGGCTFDSRPRPPAWRSPVMYAADDDTGVCDPSASVVEWAAKHAGDYGCRWESLRALYTCSDGRVQLTVQNATAGIVRAARWDAERKMTHELLCGCRSCALVPDGGAG